MHLLPVIACSGVLGLREGDTLSLGDTAGSGVGPSEHCLVKPQNCLLKFLSVGFCLVLTHIKTPWPTLVSNLRMHFWDVLTAGWGSWALVQRACFFRELKIKRFVIFQQPGELTSENRTSVSDGCGAGYPPAH